MSKIKELLEQIKGLRKSSESVEDNVYKQQEGYVNPIPKKNPFVDKSKDVKVIENKHINKPLHLTGLPMESRAKNKVYDGNLGGTNNG